MELFAADGHDAGGCERVTGKSGMRPTALPGVSERGARRVGFRIEADEAALLEVFDRAASLAPGDPLFAEALRVAGERLLP